MYKSRVSVRLLYSGSESRQRVSAPGICTRTGTRESRSERASHPVTDQLRECKRARCAPHAPSHADGSVLQNRVSGQQSRAGGREYSKKMKGERRAHDARVQAKFWEGRWGEKTSYRHVTCQHSGMCNRNTGLSLRNGGDLVPVDGGLRNNPSFAGQCHT